MIDLKEIAGLLVKQREIKRDLKSVNTELNMICFSLGIPQEFIGKMSATDFLDGYLVANGMQRMNGDNQCSQ